MISLIIKISWEVPKMLKKTQKLFWNGIFVPRSPQTFFVNYFIWFEWLNICKRSENVTKIQEIFWNIWKIINEFSNFLFRLFLIVKISPVVPEILKETQKLFGQSEIVFTNLEVVKLFSCNILNDSKCLGAFKMLQKH